MHRQVHPSPTRRIPTQPGTYSCGDGQAIKSFTVAEGGAVTLTCVDLPQFPGGGNQ